MVLRRFVSLHGYPSKLFSDNGSQLVAANKELSNITKNWDWNNLKGFGVTEGFGWIFTSADPPWQNGVTEALIRSVKRAIYASIGDSILTFSELQTVLYEVANLLNERPIGRHLRHLMTERIFARMTYCLAEPRHEYQVAPLARKRATDNGSHLFKQ